MRAWAGRILCTIDLHVNKRANAPKSKEGIAAANVELEGTDVCAVTIHSLFDLDGDTYNTKLDFAKKGHKVQVLVGLDSKG